MSRRQHRTEEPEDAARPRDRRSTRWDEHRRARRDELTAATVVAIREHGADVGMTQVAAQARTSKTVVYRHFADKFDLYLAVCGRVAEVIVRQLQEAMREASSPRETLVAGIDAYLRLIERDPEVYRYVMRPPRLERPADSDDPVADLTTLVGDHVGEVIGVELRRRGADPTPAATWGHALVGMVRSSADQWLSTAGHLTRAELTDRLADLAWAGLSGVVTSAAASA